jgi:hypothetical protein
MVWGSNPGEARFSTPLRTCPGAHPASYTMGNRSVYRELSNQGLSLTTHLYLAPRFKKEKSYTSTPLLDFLGLFQGELIFTLTIINLQFVFQIEFVEFLRNDSSKYKIKRTSVICILNIFLYDVTKCNLCVCTVTQPRCLPLPTIWT